MTLRPEYRTYEFGGEAEQALCFGDGIARQILIVPPLFDEMNRVRRMLVQAMRALSEKSVGTMLIDLPGCNESPAGLSSQSIESWTHAVVAAANQLGATHIAALRGGALVDHGNAALPHWRLAPAQGSNLLKTMIRTRIAGDKEAGLATSEASLMATAAGEAIDLAGNRIGPDMVAQLSKATPQAVPLLVERKLGEAVAGSPLWLRAEPQEDPAMSTSIAADLDSWSASCGG